MSGDRGNLTKLLIEAYSDEHYREQVGETFTALLNPNQYTTRYEIEYGERQPSGTAANAPSFSNLKPQELSLDFFLDGTGVATGDPVEVKDEVERFLELAYTYDGEIHRNRYLRVVWSSLIFDCVLKSADITYTLFDPSGIPLRAKIGARFLGFVNDELRERRQDARSPDVPHVRVVRGNERIDSLSHSIYKTPDYYIDVARANRLINFRKLEPGRALTFPRVVNEEN